MVTLRAEAAPYAYWVRIFSHQGTARAPGAADVSFRGDRTNLNLSETPMRHPSKSKFTSTTTRICLSAASIVITSSTARAQIEYTIIDLGIPPGAFESLPNGINNKGEVVGWS